MNKLRIIPIFLIGTLGGSFAMGENFEAGKYRRNHFQSSFASPSQFYPVSDILVGVGLKSAFEQYSQSSELEDSALQRNQIGLSTLLVGTLKGSNLRMGIEFDEFIATNAWDSTVVSLGSSTNETVTTFDRAHRFSPFLLYTLAEYYTFNWGGHFTRDDSVFADTTDETPSTRVNFNVGFLFHRRSFELGLDYWAKNHQKQVSEEVEPNRFKVFTTYFFQGSRVGLNLTQRLNKREKFSINTNEVEAFDDPGKNTDVLLYFEFLVKSWTWDIGFGARLAHAKEEHLIDRENVGYNHIDLGFKKFLSSMTVGMQLSSKFLNKETGGRVDAETERKISLNRTEFNLFLTFPHAGIGR